MAGPSIDAVFRDVILQAVRTAVIEEIGATVAAVLDCPAKALHAVAEAHRYEHDPYLTRRDIAFERRTTVRALYRKPWLLPGKPDGKIGAAHVWHVSRCREAGILGRNKRTDGELKKMWFQLEREKIRPGRPRATEAA